MIIILTHTSPHSCSAMITSRSCTRTTRRRFASTRRSASSLLMALTSPLFESSSTWQKHAPAWKVNRGTSDGELWLTNLSTPECALWIKLEFLKFLEEFSAWVHFFFEVTAVDKPSTAWTEPIHPHYPKTVKVQMVFRTFYTHLCWGIISVPNRYRAHICWPRILCKEKASFFFFEKLMIHPNFKRFFSLSLSWNLKFVFSGLVLETFFFFLVSLCLQQWNLLFFSPFYVNLLLLALFWAIVFVFVKHLVAFFSLLLDKQEQLRREGEDDFARKLRTPEVCPVDRGRQRKPWLDFHGRFWARCIHSCEYIFFRTSALIRVAFCTHTLAFFFCLQLAWFVGDFIDSVLHDNSAWLSSDEINANFSL